MAKDPFKKLLKQYAKSLDPEYAAKAARRAIELQTKQASANLGNTAVLQAASKIAPDSDTVRESLAHANAVNLFSTTVTGAVNTMRNMSNDPQGQLDLSDVSKFFDAQADLTAKLEAKSKAKRRKEKRAKKLLKQKELYIQTLEQVSEAQAEKIQELQQQMDALEQVIANLGTI